MTEPKKILLIFLIVMAIGLVALAVEWLVEIVGRWWIMLAGVSLAVLILLLTVHFAQAQHKPEHMELHERFYQTWMMPDNRTISCCSKEDCEPAEAYQDKTTGTWYARKVSEKDLEFVAIPAKKVEYDRDSPDGRNHMCGRRIANTSLVYCFIAGAGG